MRSLVLVLAIACKGPTPTLAPITSQVTPLPTNLTPVSTALSADPCGGTWSLNVGLDADWAGTSVAFTLTNGAFTAQGDSIVVDADGTLALSGDKTANWPCDDDGCSSFDFTLTAGEVTSTVSLELDQSVTSAEPHVVDADADGYGVGEPVVQCAADGFTAVADLGSPVEDCDDANALVSPGAPEVCNEADDDCDSMIDEDAVGWRNPLSGASGAVLDVSTVPAGAALEICGTTDITGTLSTDLSLSPFAAGAVLNGGITVAAGATLAVTDLDWVASDALAQGAVFTTSGEVTLTDVDLECLSSTVYDLGGAVHVADGGTLAMTDGSIGGCQATEGGAVYGAPNSAVSFAGATFLFNNSATGAGGAVRTVDASLDVFGATFDENEASQGGAIATVGGSVSIQYAGFTENESQLDGGAVHILGATSQVSITGAAFTDSVANGGGGGALFVDSPTAIASTQFISNLALSDGGGVLATGGLTISTASLFRDNVALVHGGAVAVTNRDLLVADSSFEANASDGNGGAFYATATPTGAVVPITFTNTSFIDNEAALQGGGAYIDAVNASEVIFANTTLTNNEARDGGGLLIVATGVPVSIDATAIDNESNQGNGGALLVDNAGAVVLTGLYNNNVSSENGGAADISATSIDLGGTYTENLALEGGAVLSAQAATLTGDGILVADNLSTTGIIVTTGSITATAWETRDNEPEVFELPSTESLTCTSCELASVDAVLYGTTSSAPPTTGVWTVTCAAGAACAYVN